MTTQAAGHGQRVAAQPIEKIVVRIRIGTELMAGTDDPLFLRLGGPAGREFRLALARGKSFRRGREDVFVLGSPDAPDTNVSKAALNDPGSPAIDLSAIEAIQLVKGQEPLPNVRGIGEMDDRIKVEEIDVSVYAKGAQPVRFYREGPHWLGLVCGRTLELARLEE